ncbi:hypothetical protein [Pseudomonas sp. NA-150]|uniref:hypothetical protein n=1 Tax=Pseudomonas sp. NA-150 TaxID=3367525 RepID=UPI0037C6200D
MNNMAPLMCEQISTAMINVCQAFRATAARNTHGTLIGVDMQGLAGDSVAGELFQHYGFTSAPCPVLNTPSRSEATANTP